jgi:carbon storage regulator
MLVLRRTAGQCIVIAGTIHITVLKIQGNGVKLGIEAPPDLAILRAELAPSEQAEPDLSSATLLRRSDKSA